MDKDSASGGSGATKDNEDQKNDGKDPSQGQDNKTPMNDQTKDKNKDKDKDPSKEPAKGREGLSDHGIGGAKGDEKLEGTKAGENRRKYTLVQGR